MSARAGLLDGPHWMPFLHLSGLHDLPMAVLETADDFLRHARAHGLADPGPRDFRYWADGDPEDDPAQRLGWLLAAFAVIAPGRTGDIRAAEQLLRAEAMAPPGPAPARHPGAWDPCANVRRTYPRRVSVRPWQLPEAIQTVLRRLAKGLPCAGTRAPATGIVHRMTEKACQFVWSVRRAGLSDDISEAAADLYLGALEERLRARPNGVRWATLRATAEDLHRLARCMALDSTLVGHLGQKRDRYQLLEDGQEAQKFAALRQTGNTTLIVSDTADALFAEAALESDPARAHKLRNGGGVLGLFSIVPLRNASAALRLGHTLFWRGQAWVIDTMIRKTLEHNPEPLVIELIAEFGAHVDAVLLGNRPPRFLPQVRERALRQQRLLFLHLDGSTPSPTYIPRLFKEFTGNSFTTARTMLHTDQAEARGMDGTLDTMRVEHQTSTGTASKYQTREARAAASRHVQRKVSARRGQAVDPGLEARLERLGRHLPARTTGEDGDADC
ncbi:hypothetical protein [Mangrovicoccus ximenensis]|uniref:hypothetical protein n=1 Tax=Mangrovicoccus ximenensis TaxID=1911570 RepID=UPI000D3BD962|nr:hypothetical protein [Mangrovicoccus ximenensis]